MSLIDNVRKEILCTTEEKKECLNLINCIINMSKKARKDGLISLEGENECKIPFFLNKALELVIDGIDPDEVQRILENYIISESYTSYELLERMIILEGVLGIQSGKNPTILRERLIALLGEKFVQQIEISSYKDINIYMEEIRDVPPISMATTLLEEIIPSMADKDVQYMLKDMDLVTIVIGIKGASGIVQNCIIRNLSKRIASNIIEQIDILERAPEHKIIAAQNKILNAIESLERNGKITYSL